MSNAFWYAVGYVAAFALGRYSLIYWTHKKLENYHRDMLVLAQSLERKAHDLAQKETEIRLKWQEMVTDFSNYHASVAPSYLQGKWTDADDGYLKSWSSAER